jgi:hypothetical protein
MHSEKGVSTVAQCDESSEHSYLQLQLGIIPSLFLQWHHCITETKSLSCYKTSDTANRMKHAQSCILLMLISLIYETHILLIKSTGKIRETLGIILSTKIKTPIYLTKTFTTLHSFIFQKIQPFITTAVRTSNPTTYLIIHFHHFWSQV